MAVHKRPVRRWFAGATALSLAVLAGSGAAGPGAYGTVRHGQARPVVDATFLYNELYHLATSYIFRVAGADGPLANPADPNNLPANYNGAQEFYQWFRQEMTNPDSVHMGPLGSFMTAKDHVYPTRVWQLDDLSVTIPGQSCPGQVALIAGHNDSTPTSTAVANGSAAGSATPMTGMRGGNWGNGSMYDAGSGEAMGMAEFQALLRWYQANGTYPKRTIKIGLFDNEEGGLVGSGFYSQTNVSTLAAPAAAGSTNVKVTSRTGVGFAAGEKLLIDPLGSPQTVTITAAGTAGATGTGLTVTPALAADHVVGTPLSAGVGDVGGLIPDGPQGQYVMVANMDQNGIEYPARHFGTEHYLNDIVGGGVGPWYTNINAVPLYTTPNDLYDATAIQRIQHNLAAVQSFRAAVAQAVSQAFAVLGQKYGFSMPLENPLRFDQVGSTPVDPGPQSVPAYLPSDIPKYSPVVDDNTGRTDQVSFIRDWGIPGYGIIGAYDTSTDPQVGGDENPYPTGYANKPTLGQYALYDTNDDTPEHLNYYASGTTHGPGGPASPSEGLRRALELPATWTSYVLAGDAYGGAEARSGKPVAYFETVPAKPFLTSTVSFDASFSRGGRGQSRDLTYYWDFGDGTTVATTNPTVTHEFSATPRWYDVKLAVRSGRSWDFYRQALAVRFVPAHFPDTPQANQPPAPATDPCGKLTATEQATVTTQAQRLMDRLGGSATVVVARRP
ncbi:MAG TPA: PKD domain-containing protein [Rugosimonospora sp.]|nr:PKD domain-containing protein [Rugosimonospora sp.]